jgi:2-polyprenyl-6-methoxyphenol hydroxylase-like FAD-dependent oxidoreductase
MSKFKYGPGVDLSLTTFHAGDGLFFQRQSDGAVRVLVTNGENPLATGQNLRADFTVDADGWASVIASTSLRGDSADVYREIKDILSTFTEVG